MNTKNAHTLTQPTKKIKEWKKIRANKKKRNHGGESVSEEGYRAKKHCESLL